MMTRPTAVAAIGEEYKSGSTAVTVLWPDYEVAEVQLLELLVTPEGYIQSSVWRWTTML